MMDLLQLSLSEALELIARREISPVELTQQFLDRIEALEPQLNAFITRMPEQALQRARQAEEALVHGNPPLPLHGIPLALKDLYDVAGVPTTAGSSFFRQYVPGVHASVVEKLVDAGAVILGKLNMHEIALGVTNVNPHYGPTHNPWDLSRITGGSSGGSGAALAAGLCLGSLGSDTGGSIRIPASLCGVVGLKPTYGRVSLRGVMPLSWNLDHAGPMARRVMDVALLLRVMDGYDPLDPYSIEAARVNFLEEIDGGVRGWQIALAVGEYFEQVAPEVKDAVEGAAEIFIDLGAEVEEVEVPMARPAAQGNLRMVTSDAAAFHRDRLQGNPSGFGADVLSRLQAGAAASSTDYALVRRLQTVLNRQFDDFFDSYDLLLTPATPVAAPPIEGPDAVEQARLLTRFTAPFNFTGLPALSLPCGFTEAGLPVGLQIAGRRWGEADVLRAGYAYEQATAWHLRQPDIG